MVAVVVPIVVLPERVVAVAVVLVLFRVTARQEPQILEAVAVAVLAHIREMVVLAVRVLSFSVISQQTQMQKVYQ